MAYLICYVILLLICLLLPEALVKKVLFWRRWVSASQRSERLLQRSYEWERQTESPIGELPQYKDYTAQLELILTLHRRLGIPLRQAMKGWRESLIRERKRSRLIDRHLQQGRLQAILMALMTWTFILTSQGLLDIVLAPSLFFIFLGLPVMGLLLYMKGIRLIEHRLVHGLDRLQQSLGRLVMLKGTGLSTGEILGLLSLDELVPAIKKGHAQAQEQFLGLLELWRERGIDLAEECRLLQDELEFLYDEAKEKLIVREAAWKIFCLLVFFLAPYLFYLIVLLGQFASV